jgi:ABC-2 type transport system ATP-binding protein
MTEVSGVLAIEVDDGSQVDASAALAAHLTGRGYEVRQDGRQLLVQITDEAVYDEIRDGAAELDLALHRLQERRHGVVDLFREPAPTQEAHHGAA